MGLECSSHCENHVLITFRAEHALLLSMIVSFPPGDSKLLPVCVSELPFEGLGWIQWMGTTMEWI